MKGFRARIATILPLAFLATCARADLEPATFPAEWEPHQATWLAWPHAETWGRDYLEEIEPIWVEMVRELRVGEEVHVLVRGERHEQGIRRVLQGNGVVEDGVHFHTIPTDDVWLRDTGPLFLRGNGKLYATVGDFNGWGDASLPQARDRRVARAVAELVGVGVRPVDLVLEGGAVEADGRGTLITTESCMLDPDRNPGLSKEEVSERLKQAYGAEHVVWLPGGRFEEDVTEGHIDGFCRFVGPNHVVFLSGFGEAETDAMLEENLRVLRASRNVDGQPFRITILEGGECNFYIGNEVVLVPTVQEAMETVPATLEALRKVFPDRRVVPIDCTALYPYGGAIHCVTQQQPALP